MSSKIARLLAKLLLWLSYFILLIYILTTLLTILAYKVIKVVKRVLKGNISLGSSKACVLRGGG
jgi:hypothetical protein